MRALQRDRVWDIHFEDIWQDLEVASLTEEGFPADEQEAVNRARAIGARHKRINEREQGTDLWEMV